MIDANINNFRSPKYHVKKYFEEIKNILKDKIIIDIPAGNGVTTELLLEYGAKPVPLDLFPEYFMLPQIECRRANVLDSIHLSDKFADMLVCQEGIEHFSDQLKVFKEFNRVLKPNGKLIVTTPSYSDLSAKFSYLLFESETNISMPPNEISDIWMSDKSITNEIYHGHIFLIGLQKLRLIAKLSGFKIDEIRYMRLSKGSLFLFPIFYPVIFLMSWIVYFKNMRKNREIPKLYKKSVYKEQLLININPKNLLNRHIFVVFEKESDFHELDFRTDSIVKTFDKIM